MQNVNNKDIVVKALALDVDTLWVESVRMPCYNTETKIENSIHVFKKDVSNEVHAYQHELVCLFHRVRYIDVYGRQCKKTRPSVWRELIDCKIQNSLEVLAMLRKAMPLSDIEYVAKLHDAYNNAIREYEQLVYKTCSVSKAVKNIDVRKVVEDDLDF